MQSTLVPEHSSILTQLRTWANSLIYISLELEIGGDRFEYLLPVYT